MDIAGVATWTFVALLTIFGGTVSICTLILFATGVEHPRWYIRLLIRVGRFFHIPLFDVLE